MTFEQWYLDNVLKGQDWQWDYKETYTYKMMKRVWDSGWEQGYESGWNDGSFDHRH